ncbi:MAG TPA: sigma-70 family RNA polymerase sigma factor [Xanthomonadales bacterium]|nr:sigma-70 family RNA polymerase sigma factor [Xanthomonadales bacterium]
MTADAAGADLVDAELAALLARLGSRDVRALDTLYGRTVDRLYALACKVAGDPRDAEEVVADVYQYAWEHADQFDAQRGGVLAWLSMLTWSRAADRRRRRKPEVAIDSLHPDLGITAYTSCEGNADAADMEAFVDGHRVRAALSQLRADQRRLILMAFFDGASHGDIAQRTGMPLGTVKSHIRRGMESLRAELEGVVRHGR